MAGVSKSLSPRPQRGSPSPHSGCRAETGCCEGAEMTRGDEHQPCPVLTQSPRCPAVTQFAKWRRWWASLPVSKSWEAVQLTEWPTKIPNQFCHTLVSRSHSPVTIQSILRANDGDSLCRVLAESDCDRKLVNLWGQNNKGYKD